MTLLQYSRRQRLALLVCAVAGMLALSMTLWHARATRAIGNPAPAQAHPSPRQTPNPLYDFYAPQGILLSSPRQLVAGMPVVSGAKPPTPPATTRIAAAPPAATAFSARRGWLLASLMLLAGWLGVRKFRGKSSRPWQRRQPAAVTAPPAPSDTQVLRHAYGELKHAFDKEEERMRQLVHLDALSRRLQRCANSAELAEQVAQCAQGIFPDAEGALYLHAEGERFGLALAWGGDTLVQTLSLLDCHALHSGQAYQGHAPAPTACAHAHSDGPYACLPLFAGSGLIGLLYLARLPACGPRHMTPWAANAIAERAANGLIALRRQEQWRIRALRDGLTGLFNRGFMEEALGIELQRAQRQGSSVGLMLLDVDHFKRYNDQHGHPAGDDLLRGFAKLLQTAVREGDMACRYGGEEFVLILPSADLAQTRQRAQALCQAIARWQPQGASGPLQKVTASIGVACYPSHGATWQQVLGQADQALYAAKHAGRNRVCAAAVVSGQTELVY